MTRGTKTYVELQVTSNFTFLRGASHPDELVGQAAQLGYAAIGITDRNSLAGVVRAHVAAKKYGIRILIGCRLDLRDGPSLLAYPTDRAAYGRLCRLLTVGKMRAPKGACWLDRADVYEYAEGLKFIALPDSLPSFPGLSGKSIAPNAASFAGGTMDSPPARGMTDVLKEYRDHFGRDLYMAATCGFHGDDARRLALLDRLSRALRIPLLATGDVHYHVPERRALQDVLTCIREKCTIDTAGFRLHANAERHLKAPGEIGRLFEGYEKIVEQTEHFAGQLDFSLEELRYEYPDEITPNGRTAQEELAYQTWKGAEWRFPAGIPDRFRKQIEHELHFIAKKEYAPFFLTVSDVVNFARNPFDAEGKPLPPILCQGRGSAANSVVCYCLGISSVDPREINLLFERFISDSRNEPPDIDVDFEHERREEVMQYIYRKYGRDRAGIVATVCEYRQKGALRDVGKAMGLSVDTIGRLGASFWRSGTKDWLDADALREQGLNPEDPRLCQVVNLAWELQGFPRHLSQHTGGFVITRGRLDELCPVMNAAMKDRTCIEWNKDDIDDLGFLKVDVLALGMLTCIRKAFDLAEKHYALKLDLAKIAGRHHEKPDMVAMYDMICRADTIGVFQIESRAQMSMLPRLRPRKFYDLVIEVAIVRPGPIQGDMVHPYLRRRRGEEKPVYPKEELKEILEKTLGVPLFQEQAMNIAIVAAKFPPADADMLRRSMATFKHVGKMNEFHEKLIGGMVANGYARDFAERLYKQLEGFGSYGFPESHAASFALLVVVSCWLKCHYPDVFACALLNSQPMGFYHAAQIIRDAREHDVVVLPADVNLSEWDNTLEKQKEKLCALRLGFCQIHGLDKDEMTALVDARGAGYRHLADLWQAGIRIEALEKLAQADAFRSLGLDRRQALWEVRALASRPAALLAPQANEAIHEPGVALPRMSLPEHVVQDYATTSFSLKAHPVGFSRDKLDRLKAIPMKDLPYTKPGTFVKTAGLVLVRQQPPTAKGVVFLTLEDETGICNLILFNDVFQKFRKEVITARFLLVEGKLEREGDVIHILAQRFSNVSSWLQDMAQPPDDDLPLLQPTLKIFPEARNFY